MISKISENSENYQFLKIHKKSVISKMSSVLCFFQVDQAGCNHLHLNLDKNCTQNANFL